MVPSFYIPIDASTTTCEFIVNLTKVMRGNNIKIYERRTVLILEGVISNQVNLK